MRNNKFLKILIVVFSFLILFSNNVVNVFAYRINSDDIYVGGMPAGFCFKTRGAYVAGLCDIIQNDIVYSPCKEAGILVGDVILNIDSQQVNTANDIEREISDGNIKTLDIQRGENNYKFKVKPIKDALGKYKLGIFIRDGVNGIGTVTYIKGNVMATLGHPVLNDGKLMPIIGGNIYKCNITGCVKGEKGTPGELRGIFFKKDEIANINKNTYSGVYGIVMSDFDLSNARKIEKGTGRVGRAKIITTIEGDTPKEYNISIIKVDDNVIDGKNFVIKITDENLLEKTNGIVQGMSGSPIIQDDKLIGAVTHVFINDPTRGFGISIDNMLINQ